MERKLIVIERSNYFAFVPRTNVTGNNSNNGRSGCTKMLHNKTSTGILNLLIDLLISNTMAVSLFGDGNGILSLRLLSRESVNSSLIANKRNLFIPSA